MTLVSVIVPTHNRADLLPRAIRSVLGQTYRNLECIVVDDASMDNTAQVVRRFEDDRLAYLRHETNKGASAARNTGIAHAKGDLIAFLDDDDEWLPTKLEKQVPFIQGLPAKVGMVYCWMDYYEEGRLVNEHHPTYRGYVFPLVLDSQRIGGCPTLLVRRPVVEKIGGFDEALPRGNDGDFIRRVCREYEVDFVPEALVKVHIGHGYEQITRGDESGIRNAIEGQKVKLVKFRDELPKYPEQFAGIYVRIAYRYGQLGDWQNCIAFYWKALKISFFSFKIYKMIFSSLKVQIKHIDSLRKTYDQLPVGIRNIYRVLRKPKLIQRRLQLVKLRFLDRHRLNDLNKVYPEEWFAARKEGVWYQDIQQFCGLIWARFEPRSVADIGCGPGVYLESFQELGVERVFGLEGSANALKHAVVPHIVQHDLRDLFHHPHRYELVLCLEVAEHIHKAYAEVLIETIIGLCKTDGHIIFTAAEPGQGGFHHINLQPRDFWVERFATRGCAYLERQSVELSEQLDLSHLRWLEKNLMVFTKTAISGK